MTQYLGLDKHLFKSKKNVPSIPNIWVTVKGGEIDQHIAFQKKPRPYKTRVSGEAGYCFFKGKVFPVSLKKRKYVNLFWLGAMEVPIEGLSFIHHSKTVIEILAP
jgi:hypothetical protein